MDMSRREVLQSGAMVMAAGVGAAGFSFGTATDYARSVHVDQWLHHPVIGDPSWDAFTREAGNPIHQGRDPYWWPVNGTLFYDPVSRAWFAYISVYPRGYWPPPPADVLILRESSGGVWDEVGYVFGRNRPAYVCKDGRQGAATDLHVVFADGRYHGIFGWCDPDNRRGGLGYASADRPEGPFRLAEKPIHDDAERTPVLGRYVRAYASTLVRRKRDWMILHMMSTPGNAGGTWALFAMVGEGPDGPYGDPIPLLAPQLDVYHPPIAEFFPAFTLGNRVYAPATSVAKNRTYQSLFSSTIENAHKPDAWRIERLGSLWHAEPIEWEAMGIWGQTIACVPTGDGRVRALYPAKDRNDRGGVGLAYRRWDRPLQKGFVLSAPNAAAWAVLRRRVREFELRADLQADGRVRICWACCGPLGPDQPSAGSQPSELMARDRHELRLSDTQWSIVAVSASGHEEVHATGVMPAAERRVQVLIKQAPEGAEVTICGVRVWTGDCHARTGRVEVVAEAGSIVRVHRFVVAGGMRPTEDDWLATEALMGAAAPPREWTEVRASRFRFGIGYETSLQGARAKWNVVGSRFTLWSPRDPAYGEADVLLDGVRVSSLMLRAEAPEPSAPLAAFSARHGRHAITLIARSGVVPCDCLAVVSDR